MISARLLFILACVLLMSCNTSNKTSSLNKLPFNETDFKLLYAKKEDGNRIQFANDSNEYFLVKFIGKRFRSFDGRFTIKGTSGNPSSEFFSSNPYTGFYNIYHDSIQLQWFKNVSWSMDFKKSERTKAIQELFRFSGIYQFDNDTLVLFQRRVDQVQKDTLIVMERVKDRS